jgi:branched-chain amino acid transport system permease protein
MARCLRSIPPPSRSIAASCCWWRPDAAGLWLLLRHTRIGLLIQAALTHPQMAEALGHNVPRVFMLVFGGGCALAALAGVIGGNAFVTEPGMAAAVGSIIFVVVVVGGLGSLAGAFITSLLIGMMQTFAVALDVSLASLGRAGSVAARWRRWRG